MKVIHKTYIANEKLMEYLDEICIYMTELKFGEYTYEADGTFKEEAQDFYEETFDEQETYLNATLDICSDINLKNWWENRSEWEKTLLIVLLFILMLIINPFIN